MRFILASLVSSLRGQWPRGLEGQIKLPCTHSGCRSGRISLAANFKDSATGKTVPLLVHVEGVDGPVCYMCYRSYYGGKVEDYASFLVREHGFDRYLVAEFEALPEVALIARPSSAKASEGRPAAPAPRPQAPAPASRGLSRPLPPRRPSGQAEFAGGQNRSAALPPRFRRPDRPVEATKAPRPTLGDLGGLADFKPAFASVADRRAAEARRQAAADQKWLDTVCASGSYGVVGKLMTGDGVALVVNKLAVLYPGGITGVIGDAGSFTGAEDAPALLVRKPRFALDGLPGASAAVAFATENGVAGYAIPSEAAKESRRFVPTEDAGVIDNTTPIPEGKPRTERFESLLAGVLAKDGEHGNQVERALVEGGDRVLSRLARLWFTMLGMGAANDELHPERVETRLVWESVQADIRARRASVPPETAPPEA